MKWKRGPASGDVEDRRGQRISGATAAKAGGGAAVIAVIVAILSQVLGGSSGGGGAGGGGAGGIDLSGLGAAISGATQGGGGGASSGGATAPIDPATDPDAELVAYIDFVMKDIQDTFATKVKGFERAKLVIFTDAVETGGCGSASSAVGPFYCPGDSKAYIDLSFYRDLKARFGAPGDFAQAYVLAHEIGHHLQNLLGANEKVARATRADKSRENDLSVRLELQADCYAGVWGNSAQHRDLLEAGDVEEAITAANAIGDDRLQKQAGARVNPETWTHGSSAQRVKWFNIGMKSGQLESCDTFSIAKP
jgi:predicted metalloprotease